MEVNENEAGPSSPGQEAVDAGGSNQLVGNDGAIADEGVVNKRNHLLSIFPVEVWLLIFKKIEDLEDREKLCNMFLSFRDIFLAERTTYLFPKVFQILYGKYHFKEALLVTPEVHKQDNGEHVLYKKCTGCGRSPAYWWFSATLSSRLVCKTWRSSVDQFLESVYPKEYNTNDVVMCPDKAFILNVSVEPEETNKFLDHFNGTHLEDHNPFLGRKIRISLVYSSYPFTKEVVPRHFPIPPEIFNLLSKYGKHIWYSHIILEHCSQSYMELRQVLEMMPNLKGLMVSYAREQTRTDRKLMLNIQSNPLPVLENLQILHLDKCPHPLSSALLRQCRQLSGLGIFGENGDGAYETMKEIEYANLKQVNTEIFSEYQFQILFGTQVNWKLNRLDLTFDLPRTTTSMEWSTIFNSLKEKCGKSLTSLKIRLPPADYIYNLDLDRSIDQFKTLRLGLPFLTKLKITMDLTSLDFLLPLKKFLEFLDISIFHRMKIERRNEIAEIMESGQTIKFLMFTGRMSNSNIWNIFPKLKKISFSERYGESLAKEDEIYNPYFRAVQYRM